MRWHLVLALVACKSPAAPSVPAGVASPAAKIDVGLLPVVQIRGEEVRHPIETRMRELQIPAVSIAVFDDYQLVWAKAYGLADVETGARADERTTFLAGSISKSVNALGQLVAVERGLLSLDTPINDALTSWKLPDNELTRAKPVTLRMLLSHTAGTTVHGFLGYSAAETIPTIRQILDGQPPANSAPIRVDLAPGTRFRYSGGGTTISQLALTEKAKQPYPQILDELILRPLGMTSSSFEQTLTPARLQHAAVGYGTDGKVVTGKRFRYPEMAAAGLWTTPTDLGRFFLEITQARAGRSTRISKATAIEMTTKVIAIEDGPAEAVGMGVFLMTKKGAPYFGHGGSDIGFQADALASLESGRGIIVMANSENGHRLFPEIHRTVFAAFGWPGAELPIVRVALEPAARAKLVGRYLLAEAPFEILERGGKLIGRYPFTDGDELVPTSATTLIHTGNGGELRGTGDALALIRNEKSTAVPRIADHALFLLEAGRFDAAVAALEEAKDPRKEEVRINALGYEVMGKDPARGAALLKINAVAFPDSANAHDSYGEALAKTGKIADAIASYERVLGTIDADPRIEPANKPLYKKRAEDELAKLRAK
jgi:CubicO group peptidase (beta-lactamase class C family)